MQAVETLRAGRPEEALQQLQELVRKSPANAENRVFLFQLLAILGQWDRAANQLKVLGDMDAKTLAMVATYRQALEAERARVEVFSGRVQPTVLGAPEAWMAPLFEALRLGAEGGAAKVAEAARFRAEALDQAPTTSGSINGLPFAWIADGDSRFGPMLEAVVGGRYVWVPFHRLRSVKMEPPADLRDLVWAPVELMFTNGGGAVALVPARYPGSEAGADAIRMSRKTDWLDQGEETFFGLGQRMLVTDAGEQPLLELRTLELDTELDTGADADGAPDSTSPGASGGA